VRVARTVEEARALAREDDVGLVPTMGALHDGHLSLMRAARAESTTLAASIFVNPSQFDDPGDLARYPRDGERDLQLAEDAGVDVLFAPSVEEMYPPGFDSWVEIGGQGAEGAARPGHFRGVATVCLKLFSIVRPAKAYFGQKDAQQAALVRRLVRDLGLDVVIRVLPTVRDGDGLALSSRNVRLSPAERERALALPRALASARGAADPVAAARSALNGLEPEYVEIVELDGARLLAAAARVGSTRLIDNVLLEGELP
jgi:pantoate--beta-alanine ligase